MRLADAHAICPLLQTRANVSQEDKALLSQLARQGEQFSPWIAPDGPCAHSGTGGLWLEMTGAAHLFGGEGKLLEQVLETFRSLVTQLRIGLADTPRGAWAASRFHPGNGLIRAGQTIKETQAYSLAALDLPTDLIQRLNRLGLRCLKDLRDIPRANLTTRFGVDITQKLDELSGQHRQVLQFTNRPQAYEVQRFFAEPLGASEVIEDRVRLMLADLCATLKEAGYGLRRLGVQFRRVDGQMFGFQLPTSAPVQDVDNLMRLLDNRLPGVDPGFGVEQIHIRVLHKQWVARRQREFSASASSQNDPDAFHNLIDRFHQRLGPQVVRYASRRSSHLPERALVMKTTFVEPSQSFPDVPPRPIRLLPQPDPVTIDAFQANGLPARFVWRRQDIQVHRMRGPERISREWWRKLDVDMWQARLGQRDYYRVCDKDGRDLWLFQQTGRDLSARWFVHGWFG